MEIGGEVFLGEGEIERGRGDDDLNGFVGVLGAVVGGRAPGGAEIGDGLSGAVAFPVAADEEGARHFFGMGGVGGRMDREDGAREAA